MTGRRAVLAGLLGTSLSRQVPGAQPGPVRVERLLRAYPDHLSRAEGDVLVWRDGTRMAMGTGLPERTFEAMLQGATIADQLRQVYEPGRPSGPPPPDHSPGRIRNTEFFVKMYGDCRFERPHRRVSWIGGQSLPVSTVNDVAGRLERVVAGLQTLPDRFRAYLVPSAGTFNCRPVADTGLPSMHGYAAAIDVNVRSSDYWVWARNRGEVPYRNRIPFEIVEVFEAERFIWGGKWYHYDTMHFEYRPELLG
ncbi:M15 family metallopeptidase [Muricoccus radiodurans]|uniref:M15 family metallopeptidase n=1 Tax=Muricoccus radiodurans TaxID=2231721 RepID=UPI003CEC68FF